MYVRVNDTSFLNLRSKTLVGVEELPKGSTVELPDWHPDSRVWDRDDLKILRVPYTTLKDCFVYLNNRSCHVKFKNNKVISWKVDMIFLDCGFQLFVDYKVDDIVKSVCHKSVVLETLPDGVMFGEFVGSFHSRHNVGMGMSDNKIRVSINGMFLNGSCYCYFYNFIVLLLRDDFSLDAIGIVHEHEEGYVDISGLIWSENAYILKSMLLATKGVHRNV